MSSYTLPSLMARDERIILLEELQVAIPLACSSSPSSDWRFFVITGLLCWFSLT